jgi:DNA-directed RNA polymerase subunit K/omega
MIHPTIQQLTYDGKYNRYELALATAKCARKITNEYARQRDAAEKAMTGNKDTDKPLMNMIDREYRDEKAVKIAINKMHAGEYTIVEHAPEEPDYVPSLEPETRNPFAGMNDEETEAVAEENDEETADEEEEGIFDPNAEEEEEEEEELEPSDEELLALEKNLKLD